MSLKQVSFSLIMKEFFFPALVFIASIIWENSLKVLTVDNCLHFEHKPVPFLNSKSWSFTPEIPLTTLLTAETIVLQVTYSVIKQIDFVLEFKLFISFFKKRFSKRKKKKAIWFTWILTFWLLELKNENWVFFLIEKGWWNIYETYKDETLPLQ